LWTHSLRSGPNADPHRSFVAGRVAAAGLFARALIALLVELARLVAAVVARALIAFVVA